MSGKDDKPRAAKAKQMPSHPVTSWARLNVLQDTYFSMCEDSYSRYVSLFERLSDYEAWDEERIDLEHELNAKAIGTVVFAGMCVEAAIYDYSAIQLGDSFVRKHFDKMDLVSKWVVIPKYICGVGLSKGGAAFGRLKRLVADRNDLVHCKSKPVSVSDPVLYEQLEREKQDSHDSVNNAYRAVVLLSLEMESVLGARFNPLRSFDKKVNPLLEVPSNLRGVIAECKATFAKSISRD
ncbi:hypothetical protein GM160_01185 [Guyparkeria halophila]|uniref:Uncharacterized protein n=1 Tax=Guyparkeria halophila TaxID=47960 RepID=A0A6I6CUC5_9GAMM|nr:hypothetical protein [Guyparkeria halophila]QGT77609.1 hypothetical protein GM160_01185 [Guyparkeria halophila]